MITQGSDQHHPVRDLSTAVRFGNLARLHRLVMIDGKLWLHEHRWPVDGPDGVIEAAYVQLLDGGELAAGRMTSRPHFLPDGRVRLAERWQRDDGSSGTSWIEQIPG